MSWLTFLFALELGFMPMGDYAQYAPPSPDLIILDYSFYTELEADVLLWDLFFIGGGVRTGMWHATGGYTFWPHRSTYEFRAGVRWRLLEFGFRHFCMHPVVPYFALWELKPVWEGGYEELYLRISNR